MQYQSIMGNSRLTCKWNSVSKMKEVRPYELDAKLTRWHTLYQGDASFFYILGIIFLKSTVKDGGILWNLSYHKRLQESETQKPIILPTQIGMLMWILTNESIAQANLIILIFHWYLKGRSLITLSSLFLTGQSYRST